MLRVQSLYICKLLFWQHYQ